MYKAIRKIGGYKVGDVVPDEKAKVWLEMYAVPHVEKVDKEIDDEEKPKESKELENPKKEGNILEDYLGRNENVVKKNISEDDLSNHQLKELLKLEKADKKRLLVIEAIKRRLRK